MVKEQLKTQSFGLFSHIKSDVSSGLVVFLVALPLCLGIALASGASPLPGIISGVIGGLVVGFLSNSHLSVSGPAAGLTAIVAKAIIDLGSFETFLLAVFIAGIFQLALGFIKAGTISNYFPNNVIEGMLAGIGIIIILKQLPHAFGYDADYEGDESFVQPDGRNSFTEFFDVFQHLEPGAILIAAVSLVVLISWNYIPFLKKINLLPAALVVVILGVLINSLLLLNGHSWALQQQHLVALPVPKDLASLSDLITTPDFSAIQNSKVWVSALSIAVIASIETLLCIEAADRMDVHKRYTDTNRELKAQGIGNMLSSMLGGLPMTSVVVRTSANKEAGAQTKLSTIVHGLLLLVAVVFIPSLLNKIPLATLAAILLMVGYKLAKPSVFIHFWKRGKYQFLPFLLTFLAVILTDLLIGVALGLVLSIIFVLWGNLRKAFDVTREMYTDGEVTHISLAQEVSFLNKTAIKNTLAAIPENSRVLITAHQTVYIANDILDLIKEFTEVRAKERNISVKLRGFKEEYKLDNAPETVPQVRIEQYYDVAKRQTVVKEITDNNF
ncbi:SulP family inorganic anion transporter [Flavobacterium sp.]|uniref:SulP family inorganic anion transporter n=1 Tax=Flavobacterium sp. TaxID=239 RepID=UPI00260875BF|nr:SulP family inorganic anion transporter [Flavobacterium sp.]